MQRAVSGKKWWKPEVGKAVTLCLSQGPFREVDSLAAGLDVSLRRCELGNMPLDGYSEATKLPAIRRQAGR